MTRPIDTAGRLLLIGAAAGALFGVPTAFTMLSAHAPAVAAAAPAGTSEIGDAPIVEGDDETGSIARATDGLFYAQVRINGMPRRCLVDSGATGLVLNSRDARTLAPGNRPRFTGRLVTAAGSHPAARTRLASLTIAGREMRDVPAILVVGGTTPCLLGQNVLARLDAVELHGDRLILR